MSDCNCCDDPEADEQNDTEKKFEAFIRAGELAVQVEGESSEKAREEVEALWDKAIEDVGDMPEGDREQIGLQ